LTFLKQGYDGILSVLERLQKKATGSRVQRDLPVVIKASMIVLNRFLKEIKMLHYF